jgi:uncharacterized membrane protein
MKSNQENLSVAKIVDTVSCTRREQREVRVYIDCLHLRWLLLQVTFATISGTYFCTIYSSGSIRSSLNILMCIRGHFLPADEVLRGDVHEEKPIQFC